MAGKFELRKSANGQFHFRLKAGNGEPILSGESYTTKAGAQNGIKSVKPMLPLRIVMNAKPQRTGSRFLF